MQGLLVTPLHFTDGNTEAQRGLGTRPTRQSYTKPQVPDVQSRALSTPPPAPACGWRAAEGPSAEGSV